MPFGDGTGPSGQGSMTGRGLGYCAGYRRPGYTNPVPGRGLGRGRGRGWYNWRGPAYYTPNYSPAYPSGQPTAKEEKEIIQQEIEMLREEMKGFEDRLKELKKKK